MNSNSQYKLSDSFIHGLCESNSRNSGNHYHIDEFLNEIDTNLKCLELKDNKPIDIVKEEDLEAYILGYISIGALDRILHLSDVAAKWLADNYFKTKIVENTISAVNRTDFLYAVAITQQIKFGAFAKAYPELHAKLLSHITAKFDAASRKVQYVSHPSYPPKKVRFSDSGFDLYAVELVRTHDVGFGIVEIYNTKCVLLPPPGISFHVNVRSSIGLRYMLTNGTGIIDNTYTGEILISLLKYDKNAKGIEIGERICQAIPVKNVQVLLESTDIISTTERGTGGFGSTGSGLRSQK